MNVINPLYDELDGIFFHYGKTAFTSCIYILIFILCLTTSSILQHVSLIKKKSIFNQSVIYSLVFSFIECLLLIEKLNFQFSNISMYFDLSLFYKTIAVCVLGFILFIIQIILLLVRKFSSRN